MLFDKIRDLCKENKITIAQLERNLMFGNGTIHRWDVSQPSADKLSKVADYFSVSIDYLLGREKGLPSPDAKDFAKIYDNLSAEQKNLLKCYISIITSCKEMEVAYGRTT